VSEVLISADPTKVTIAALAAALPDAVVSSVVDNPRPTRLVRVRPRGGTREDEVLDGSLILIECWAEDEMEASDLARRAAGHFNALSGTFVGSVWVVYADVVGLPADDPDPDTSTPRYTLTGQLVLLAEPES
jgi:hypothetical protein